MLLITVSVFDRAAQTYGRPFFVTSEGYAVRSFIDEVNRDDKDNLLFHHSTDFDLYMVGVFDDSDGRFETLADPKFLIAGKSVRK